MLSKSKDYAMYLNCIDPIVDQMRHVINKLKNITNKNNNYVELYQNNYPDELGRKRLVISLQTHTHQNTRIRQTI